MRKNFLLIAVIFVTSLFSGVLRAETDVDTDSRFPLALVYAGAGACPEGCATAAAKVARAAGYRVRFVKAGQITAENLSKASLWVQPGGDALKVRSTISEKEFSDLKEFVANGGNYLGFCAGAYFATKFIDDGFTIPGLDFIPGDSADFLKGDKDAHLETILWQGTQREIYFQDGPTFIVDPGHDNIVKATYLNGKPAIVFTPYKKGYVALSGPHPEAPNKWFKADGLARSTNRHAHSVDNEDDQEDLDIALEMVSWFQKSHAR